MSTKHCGVAAVETVERSLIMKYRDEESSNNPNLQAQSYLVRISRVIRVLVGWYSGWVITFMKDGSLHKEEGHVYHLGMGKHKSSGIRKKDPPVVK